MTSLVKMNNQRLTPWVLQQYYIPISRSCQGCAAIDLLVIEESILSLSGGCAGGWETGVLLTVSIGGAIIAATLNKNNVNKCTASSSNQKKKQ